MQSFIDYWGNKVGLFSIIQSHKQLIIESKLTVRTTSPDELQVNFISGFDQMKQEIGINMLLLELTRPDSIEKQQIIQDICDQVYNPSGSVAIVVDKSSKYIFENFKYTKGITTIESTVDEILEHQEGVCQDFAHVLLQILRTLNIPCRYVSGYICPNKNGMRGEGATHAWVEAWIPQHGWAGIDPTNNVWVTNTHVKLAVGRNFTDCSPVKGSFKGPARQDLFVLVNVGYEDGHYFEETNRVKMDKLQVMETETVINQSFAAQQQ
jgi:transglutaminase-like putative cysteine protease